MTTALLEESDVRPRASRWLLTLAACTSLLFLLGLAVRLTVQDHYLYLATVFYALPLPVLAFVAMVTAGLFRHLRFRRASRLWSLTTVCMVLWCAASMTHWHHPVGGAGESMRLLFWNTCRGNLGWKRVAAAVNDIQPDVAGLVEAGESGDDRRSFWKDACPGYYVSLLGGGIVCLTKEPPGDGIAVSLPGNSNEYRQLDVTAHGQTVTLLIVDLDSDPLHPRQATLEQLATDAEALSDRPVVIVGDFNTPAESVHFGHLRQHHRQAFEIAGAGYKATWPVPLPVLCLDHVWVNDQVQVGHCTQRWTSVSDHRPVVADVRVAR